MYFHKTPRWLKFLYPGLTWEKKHQNDKSIYLTFDDGPVPDVTEYVLETLREYQAKATFFCVGENIKKNPKALEQIIAGGHSLGNHTQQHLNGWKTEDKTYLRDVALCDEIMNQHVGHKRDKLFRPPYGRAKRSQIKEIIKDHQIVMWDVLSGDFDQKLAKEDCLERTIKCTETGSIVIFHDSFKAEKNLRYVLPLYLEYFSARKFRFSTL